MSSALAPPAPLAPPTLTPSGSSWTFTQGLLLGQASFLLIALIFIRYVVFSPNEEGDDEGWRQRRAERTKRAVLSTTSVPPPPTSHILSKTEYDMSTQSAESSGWINVLLAQILQGYRNDLLSAGGEEGARQRVEKWLNPAGGSISWLDPIQVTSLSLGSAYPLLSQARIRPADGQGRIRAEIDLDYLDSLHLSLSTSVLINFPRPRFAVLPVSLGVELVSICGTLSVQIHDPANQQQHLHACLLPDFHLNIKTTTLLGSRAKLQDVPKLEQLIISRLRSTIQDRLVYPNHLSFALPRLLSPSVSPTPILSDIGQGAGAAMSEAVEKKLDDLAATLNASGSSHESSPEKSPPTQDVTEPTSPTRSQRKIPMPAEFPRGESYASSSSYAGPIPSTPLRTPSTAPPNYHAPFPPSVSSYRPPSMQGLASSAAPSLAGRSHAQSNPLRFRGQFASQPPTPGEGHGLGLASSFAEPRRMGALNSRPM